MEQEEKTCVGCRFFKQHYTRIGNQTYIVTNFGHCSNPRLREKKPDTPACHRFSKKSKK